jgi:6-pyruvoyl-tetrahydropterin synthase
MKGCIPTAENMAIAFWGILKPKIKEGTLVSIKLSESGNNFVEYRGE